MWNILHQTIIYTASVHSVPRTLQLSCDIRSDTFPRPVYIPTLIYVLQSCKPDLDITENESVHFKLQCCSFTYSQSLPKFYSQQILIRIQATSSVRPYTKDAWISRYDQPDCESSNQEQPKCDDECFDVRARFFQLLDFPTLRNSLF